MRGNGRLDDEQRNEEESADRRPSDRFFVSRSPPLSLPPPRRREGEGETRIVFEMQMQSATSIGVRFSRSAEDSIRECAPSTATTRPLMVCESR